MKKNDSILIFAVLVIASLFFGYHFFGKDSGEGIVEVKIDGAVYGRYQLNEDQTIEVNQKNRLKIEDGTAQMVWAECRDQICMHHKAISRSGESIICLPNKVVVSIVNGKKSELDAVAG